MGSISNGHDMLVLDGTAESNSGQSFRMAIALSAITLKPIRIQNVWGAKQPANKRGMKPANDPLKLSLTADQA